MKCMDLFKKHCQDFNNYINSLPKEVIEAENKKELEQNSKDFKEFKEALAKGDCFYCGHPISHFSQSKPCFHWLLKPKGFKKKHFPLLYADKSFHQLEAYLRWVANSDRIGVNINDLVEEKNTSKIIEQTICYKNLEWSFSCSKGDMDGHAHKHEGTMPHYHFQMKVDGNVIINYSGFHIPFQDVDHFYFAMKKGAFDRMEHRHIQGAGMQTIFDNFKPEELLNLMRTSTDADDPQKSPFHMETFVMAKPGTTISGDEIAELQKESHKTGVPMAKLLRKLKNVQVSTVIQPGPALPEIAKRTPR
jgi:hypothetical protein